MTPAARVAAAIEVLDAIFDGVVAEKALTSWGRSHRFAGSKDRAAIRDHVFQALRCRSSYGWRGGAETGRGVMLGACRATGLEAEIFTGEGHAPAPVKDEEAARDLADADRATLYDMPDWLLAHFDQALGEAANTCMTVLQLRAGLFLRVNEIKADVDSATRALAQDGIKVAPVQDIKNALQVIENERRVAQSSAYRDGLVEIQDASSQWAMNALDIRPGLRVLDLCAGGGGKALALAARGAQVIAHDVDARRMQDIAPRAARAGVSIETITTDQLKTVAPFDLVLVDAPCSGSGTWRRTPAAKWALTAARLDELRALQAEVLHQGATLVRDGGTLSYATCSVFECENIAQIQQFMSGSSSFALQDSSQVEPHAQGDGFYLAQLSKLINNP